MAASPRTLPRGAQRAPAQPRGRHLPAWRAVLAGSAWAGMVLAVTLHLVDGTAQHIGSIPGMLGEAAGLVAVNSMLFMLLLTARVPVLDRVIGQAKAARWNRRLGQVTVLGVLSHAVLVLLGAGSNDGISGVITLLWKTDLLLACAAIALLALVALGSAATARHRLRHDTRHVAHVLSCFAALLALPHVFSTESALLSGTFQRIYWTVLLLAVGACLLGYRLLIPLYRSWRHHVKLTNTVHLAPGLLHLEFTGRNLKTLKARGGQYFTWRLLTPQLWARARRIYLSAAPANDRLRITIQVTGDDMAELAAARPGTRVVFGGPYGAFTDASRTRNGLVLIGTGSGVAPVRALLDTTTAHPADTVVILRASRAEDLPLLDEFQELCDDRGIRLHLMTGPGHEDRWVSIGYAGHDLSTLAPDLQESDVFVCGPRGFVASVLAEAGRLGVAPEQCHGETLAP